MLIIKNKYYNNYFRLISSLSSYIDVSKHCRLLISSSFPILLFVSPFEEVRRKRSISTFSKTVNQIYLICLMAQAACHYMLGDSDLAEIKFQNLYKLILAGSGKAFVSRAHLEFISKVGMLDSALPEHHTLAEQLIATMDPTQGDTDWR